MKAKRLIMSLEKARLIKKGFGKWDITKDGEKALSEK